MYLTIEFITRNQFWRFALVMHIHTFVLINFSVTCPKCEHKRAFFMQIQTRSADEPMTTFYKCCNMSCSHQWRDWIFKLSSSNFDSMILPVLLFKGKINGQLSFRKRRLCFVLRWRYHGFSYRKSCHSALWYHIANKVPRCQKLIYTEHVESCYLWLKSCNKIYYSVFIDIKTSILMLLILLHLFWLDGVKYLPASITGLMPSNSLHMLDQYI